MMEQPLLTIAIPTYNRAYYLNMCLASILPQVKKSGYNIEVLVSDNCATDNTDEIVKKYKSEYDLIYVKHSENTGPDINFAGCVAMAKGKYVWLFGDDEILYPGMLKRILDILAADNLGVLHLKGDGYDKEPVTLVEYTSQSDLNLKEFDNNLSFMEEVNVDITFITGNIFNKSLLDTGFDYYRFTDTFLIQLGWTVSAVFKAEKNAVLENRAFAAKQNNTGGYRLATIFCKNLNDIFDQFIKTGIDKRIKTVTNSAMFKTFFPHYIGNILYSENNFKKENHGLIIFKVGWKYKNYWKYLFPVYIKYYLKKFLPVQLIKKV